MKQLALIVLAILALTGVFVAARYLGVVSSPGSADSELTGEQRAPGQAAAPASVSEMPRGGDHGSRAAAPASGGEWISPQEDNEVVVPVPVPGSAPGASATAGPGSSVEPAIGVVESADGSAPPRPLSSPAAGRTARSGSGSAETEAPPAAQPYSGSLPGDMVDAEESFGPLPGEDEPDILPGPLPGEGEPEVYGPLPGEGEPPVYGPLPGEGEGLSEGPLPGD